MTAIKTYKVTYQAPNGRYCSFKFSTDRSFKYYGNDSGGGFCGLGGPFCRDMMKKVAEIEQRDDSAMKRNGGFSYFNIKKITCIDTKEIRYFA